MRSLPPLSAHRDPHRIDFPAMRALCHRSALSTVPGAPGPPLRWFRSSRRASRLIGVALPSAGRAQRRPCPAPAVPSAGRAQRRPCPAATWPNLHPGTVRPHHGLEGSGRGLPDPVRRAMFDVLG